MNFFDNRPILKSVLLGIVLTGVFVPVCGYIVLRYGLVPPATADTPLPDEQQIDSSPPAAVQVQRVIGNTLPRNGVIVSSDTAKGGIQ